jgi:hypothetical protein
LQNPLEKNISDKIRRDIHRTFPEDRFFQSAPKFASRRIEAEDVAQCIGARQAQSAVETGGAADVHLGQGQEMLLVVNRAFSLYDKDIGYCQGMNFIVAGIVMHQRKPEIIFWILERIMNHYKLGAFQRGAHVILVMQRAFSMTLPCIRLLVCDINSRFVHRAVPRVGHSANAEPAAARALRQARRRHRHHRVPQVDRHHVHRPLSLAVSRVCVQDFGHVFCPRPRFSHSPLCGPHPVQTSRGCVTRHRFLT